MIRIIIWDNDGTVMGSKNPNDSSGSKVILPHVEEVMKQADVNVICSGCKTEESEKKNFDPIAVTERFRKLMELLPIKFAVFSPATGGTECYVVTQTEVFESHKDPRYQHLIGEFKKPGIGMLIVIQDILEKEYTDMELIMIGDTWHDREAADDGGIRFIEAEKIHGGLSI